MVPQRHHLGRRIATSGRQGGSSVCLEGCGRVGGLLIPSGQQQGVFDAEVYAVSQALEILDRRQVVDGTRSLWIPH